MDECEKLSGQGVSEVTKGIDRLRKLITQQTVAKKQVYSQEYHAANVEVDDEGLVCKRFEGSGGYPICLTN